MVNSMIHAVSIVLADAREAFTATTGSTFSAIREFLPWPSDHDHFSSILTYIKSHLQLIEILSTSRQSLTDPFLSLQCGIIRNLKHTRGFIRETWHARSQEIQAAVILGLIIYLLLERIRGHNNKPSGRNIISTPMIFGDKQECGYQCQGLVLPGRYGQAQDCHDTSKHVPTASSASSDSHESSFGGSAYSALRPDRRGRFLRPPGTTTGQPPKQNALEARSMRNRHIPHVSSVTELAQAHSPSPIPTYMQIRRDATAQDGLYLTDQEAMPILSQYMTPNGVGIWPAVYQKALAQIPVNGRIRMSRRLVERDIRDGSMIVEKVRHKSEAEGRDATDLTQYKGPGGPVRMEGRGLGMSRERTQGAGWCAAGVSLILAGEKCMKNRLILNISQKLEWYRLRMSMPLSKASRLSDVSELYTRRLVLQ